VHLQGELDALLVENVYDGVPAVGEVLVAVFDHGGRDGRKAGQGVPDLGAGEAIDYLDPKLSRGAGGVFNLLGGALAHTLGVAIAPDVAGQNALVALVDDGITHGLAHHVVADGVAAEPVPVENVPARAHVGVVAEGF